MTPRERARTISNDRVFKAYPFNTENLLTELILADRQALQSEIVRRVDELIAGKYESAGFVNGLNWSVRIMKSVFAQQSQPPESKPKETEIKTTGEFRFNQGQSIWSVSGWLPIAESDRRVLAEREACAKIAGRQADKARDWYESGNSLSPQYTKGNWEGAVEIQNAIRVRSNQSEEAEANAKKNCEASVSILADSMKRLDQSARIATLHEWQAKDALIIRQLNESNSLLSKKIAQLEKEKNELTQKVKEFDDYMQFLSESEFSIKHPGSTNRKA